MSIKMLHDKAAIITTSWDDGHPLDLRVADLLAKYGLKGTFYVPLSNSEHAVLGRSELLALSAEFEIGGHTASHVDLTRIPFSAVSEEIASGKLKLEDAICRPVPMFCYPRGHYNQLIKAAVRKAGFQGARTASWFHGEYPEDPFAMHPTIHVYPHTPLIHAAHLLKEVALSGLARYILQDNAASDLRTLTARWLDRVLSRGGILHIWGHSWEVESLNLWVELESLFRYVSENRNILHLTNGEIIRALYGHGGHDQR